MTYYLLNDHELVRLANKADDKAFSQLVARYQSAVRGLLWNMLHDEALLDDIAQTSFLIAWEKIHTFRFQSFKAWICSIAYKQGAMHLRRAKLERSYARELAQQQAHEAHYNKDAESQLEQNWALAKALETLSSNQQQVIILIYKAGMTYAEVSEIMDVPLSTVKSHGQRGLASLLKQLNGEHNDNQKC